MIAREIQASGLSALAAFSLCGSRALTVSATGTTGAAGTDLTCAINVITTCTEAACAVQLPVNDIGDSITVINATAVNARVFPPTGGAFNGGTADVPVTLGANRGTTFYQTGTSDYGTTV